ncbi:hypothetical protein ACJMK2_006381 [Sinanodonta woodiana]|uniref:L-Fucosyltransferase n=1 Tax=Sinanodonta woodiana TaxID=1069815 RepID=A0ABD3VT01_SINWO
MSIQIPIFRGKPARYVGIFIGMFLLLAFGNYVLDVVNKTTISSSDDDLSSKMTNGKFLCYTYRARLGNHMFQFASLTGIAALNNRTIIVGKDDYLYQVFNLKNVLVIRNRDICNSFYFIEESLGCCKFDAHLMTLREDKNYKIGLYLQSWKYFYHVQDIILRQFRFRESIEKTAMRIVKNIRVSHREHSLTLIGIHIRIGDIANEMHNRNGLVIAPEGYIYKAMDYMKSRFPNSIFIVASDDMEWTKNVLSLRLNDSVHLLEKNNMPYVDLAVLASCDHVIQTVGSFGWWAAFLARGISIYYPHPGRVGSVGEARYNYEDFFPPNWIPIDV